jgi:hypothetical protein
MVQSSHHAQQTVFLQGSPRSGTTWMAKIIDSDPTVLYRHEPDSINVRPDIPFVPTSAEAGQNLQVVRDYINELGRERASKSAGSQPMFDKDFRGPGAEMCRKLIVLALKSGERLPTIGDVFTRLQIPDFIPANSTGTSTLFIKSVSSLCRTLLFSSASPELKFIHIMRNPCAYVASTIRGKKLGLLSDDAYIETLAAMPESQQYGLDLETLTAMSRIEQLAARWMLQNSKVINEMKGAANYRQVIYEELCNDPGEVVASLFEFLGLRMSQQTHDFIASSSAAKGGETRYFDLTRDSAAAASSWRRELTEHQIERVKSVVSSSPAGQLYFSE